MALRLIEIILPEAHGVQARKLLEEQSVIGIWQDQVADTLLLLRVLTAVERSESVMDALQTRFSAIKDFRVILLPVEASIPRPTPRDTEGDGDAQGGQGQEKGARRLRISRQELYHEVYDGAQVTPVFVAMVVLSSIVAAIGLMRDNVAVLIGAMVIAPMLGPYMALALATTLGDTELGKSALKTSVIGMLIALVFSVLAGALLPFAPEVPEISSRTQVGLSDIALALASGAAGALAFTTGISTVLIGVMVAVALLPPLVTFGLLMGSGKTAMAQGALLLFLTNVICVNLAGVGTFLLQGIRPLTWWDANRARKSTIRAMALWMLLLVLLAGVIVYVQRA